TAARRLGRVTLRRLTLLQPTGLMLRRLSSGSFFDAIGAASGVFGHLDWRCRRRDRDAQAIRLFGRAGSAVADAIRKLHRWSNFGPFCEDGRLGGLPIGAATASVIAWLLPD